VVNSLVWDTLTGECIHVRRRHAGVSHSSELSSTILLPGVYSASELGGIIPLWSIADATVKLANHSSQRPERLMKSCISSLPRRCELSAPATCGSPTFLQGAGTDIGHHSKGHVFYLRGRIPLAFCINDQHTQSLRSTRTQLLSW
jgi:hypothetical protein